MPKHYRNAFRNRGQEGCLWIVLKWPFIVIFKLVLWLGRIFRLLIKGIGRSFMQAHWLNSVGERVALTRLPDSMRPGGDLGTAIIMLITRVLTGWFLIAVSQQSLYKPSFSGIGEFVGSLSVYGGMLLAFGFLTRLSALVLLVCWIFTSIFNAGQFTRDIPAIFIFIPVLLSFAAFGAGGFSVDAIIARSAGRRAESMGCTPVTAFGKLRSLCAITIACFVCFTFGMAVFGPPILHLYPVPDPPESWTQRALEEERLIEDRGAMAPPRAIPRHEHRPERLPLPEVTNVAIPQPKPEPRVRKAEPVLMPFESSSAEGAVAFVDYTLFCGSTEQTAQDSKHFFMFPIEYYDHGSIGEQEWAEIHERYLRATTKRRYKRIGSPIELAGSGSSRWDFFMTLEADVTSTQSGVRTELLVLKHYRVISTGQRYKISLDKQLHSQNLSAQGLEIANCWRKGVVSDYKRDTKVNLRVGPSVEHPISRAIPNGTQIEYVPSGASKWWFVRTQDGLHGVMWGQSIAPNPGSTH